MAARALGAVLARALVLVERTGALAVLYAAPAPVAQAERGPGRTGAEERHRCSFDERGGPRAAQWLYVQARKTRASGFLWVIVWRRAAPNSGVSSVIS